VITAELKGVDQVLAALRKLPQLVADRGELEQAALEVGKPVAEAMAAAAPKRRGRYARSFTAAIVEPDQRQQVKMRIGPTQRGFYGRFLEFGTWKVSPRPHIRPTWDAHRNQVIAALRGRVAAIVAKAARRTGFKVAA
jgi:HK97 gp10 family phage protein